jgi:hypothetical protein
MSVRKLGVVLAMVAATATGVVVPAMPASAGIGIDCGGWDGTVGVPGVRINACTDRRADGTVRGRGRAYYVGSWKLDQLSISVQLQRSIGGSIWSTVRSNVCGWSGGDIADSTPGNVCATGPAAADGALYRSRVSVTVFYAGGSMDTSSFVVSDPTT